MRKLNIKISLILSILLVIVILTGCISTTEILNNNNNNNNNDEKIKNNSNNDENQIEIENSQDNLNKIILGSDRDEHGCIGSAGYMWNETMQECVRPWEVGNTDNQDLMVGNDTDEHGCISSAGYQWCDLEKRCVKIWEESKQIQCSLFDGIWLNETKECEKISEKDCNYMGGTFDDCASACRNEPSSDICTLNCVQVCKIE